jgi:nicotinamidase-related amidase/phenylpyruvate tautomerase PptA (4-oxalocrotonate tautomerase family)
MPFVHLTVARPNLGAAQRRELQAGLTGLMASVLHKQASLTVVLVEQTEAAAWSVGGAPIGADGWLAQLDAYVTAGTNTSAECSRFIAAAYALLAAQLGPARPVPAAGDAPVYIMVHELPADRWGYDGLTQEARRQLAGARPRTLRAWAGTAAAPPPGPAASALLLIDFQREYRDGQLPLAGIGEAVRQAALLEAAATAAGVPVVHVLHESAGAGATLFAAGGSGAAPLDELPVRPGQHRIVKTLPSAFHRTGLAELLDRLGVRTLVLAGCMTHNCIDSTAREALHRGYAVLVAADACATRALPATDGGVLGAEQVQAASLAALADRHADVLCVDALVRAWRAVAPVA